MSFDIRGPLPEGITVLEASAGTGKTYTIAALAARYVAEGIPLEQAVVDAGAIRFRPMLLTAAAVIVGAFMILFDPIFQGLAISLMAGEVASLFLSRMTVPVVYFMLRRREHRKRTRSESSESRPMLPVQSPSYSGSAE